MVNANRILNYFLILLLLGIALSFAQEDFNSAVIARVGQDSITVKQFTELFELTPRISNSNSSSITAAKIDFLHTLIGNKIWYQHRKSKGADTSIAEYTARTELDILFTLDFLYRKEILNKSEPSEDMIYAAYQKASKTLSINYLFSKSNDEINNLYKLLEIGFDFNEVLNSRDEKEDQNQPLEVNFGDFNPTIENILFGLEIGGYTEPIKQIDGFYIFYLSNIQIKQFLDNKSYLEELDNIKNILKKRNEDLHYNDFMMSVLSGKNVVISKKIRDDLVNKLDARFRANLFNNVINDSTVIISSWDVLAVEKEIGNQNLNSAIIRIDSINITLNRFLRALVFTKSKFYFVGETCQQFIENNISEYLQKLILYERASELHYNKSEEVQRNIKIWTEFYSFESVRASIADTIKLSDELVTKTCNDFYGSNFDVTSSQNLNKVELIKNQLINNKVGNILKFKTAEIAKDFTIDVNYGLLQSLEASSINSFSIRKLGFGGNIPAVPIYFPNHEWVNPGGLFLENLP